VLFGYGEMGCTALEFLRANGEDVAAVITHRDNPAEKQWFRSLAQLAASTRTPTHIGEEIDLRNTVSQLRPDLILSFYYRDMIPTNVLSLAPQGALNLHGSKLPRLRGRAPINWALVECEEETGVTLHHMVKEPDAGDIVAQRSWRIGPRDTAKDLFDRAVAEARILLREVWPAIRAGTAPRTPQDPAKATYRGRRTPEDGRIDWTKPARRIDGLVRAVTDPFPGAFTVLDGTKLMIWAGEPVPGRGPAGSLIGERIVATGEGAYRIDRWTAPDGSSPKLSSGMVFEGVRT
jgi:methionyl-tRNA formyltransferase